MIFCAANHSFCPIWGLMSDLSDKIGEKLWQENYSAKITIKTK
jgi:hypothetical protein